MAAGLLAVLSAAGDGLSDFLGGLLSRTSSAWPDTSPGQSRRPSVPVLIAVAATLRPRWAPLDRAGGLVTLTGPLGTLSTGAFLLATQHGCLSIAGILVSLYPAGTLEGTCPECLTHVSFAT
jgi:drug/metabolite transporter (DMT)-like permease